MIYDVSDNKLIFNVSKGKPNLNQREHKFKWQHPKNANLKMDGFSMCNVSSIIMALHYANWNFPKGRFEQDADNLCAFIYESKEVMERYEKTMPAMAAAFKRGDNNATPPNLIHDLIAFGTNRWLGATDVVTFNMNRPITTILREVIMFNRPVVMSGGFPYTYLNGTKGTLGHINVLVGVVYDITKINPEELFSPQGVEKLLSTQPDSLVFDDPFGDYKKNFSPNPFSGNDVITPWADFIRMYRPERDVAHKWGHFIKPGACVQ